ncbi:PrgI family protein [Candidatus Saccharibacteria bacterium]|nr:MAG: PrgI family protein [Candidatus Saccharibacteria bacterium]
MATYKVIQDIEAEDKLVGPLSLKQFIFALIAIFLGFLIFKLAIAEVLGLLRWLFITLLLPPTLLFAVLAAPIGGDQSTELWLLARIRFMLKPRKRIWNQAGPKQLVTITAPKKLERRLTKNFSQDEARSRLGALANVMDSRGWAVKNVNVNLNVMQNDGYTSEDDDRLTPALAVPQQVEMADISAADDILDESNNSTAQHFDELIDESEREHRDLLQEQIDRARYEKQTTSLPEPNVPESVNMWFEGKGRQPNVDQGTSERVAVPNAHPKEEETLEYADLPDVNYVHGGGGQTITPGTASVSSIAAAGSTSTTNDAADPSSLDEKELLEKVRQKQTQSSQANTFGHLKRLKPLQGSGGDREQKEGNEEREVGDGEEQDKQKQDSPKSPNPVIINMSKDNDKTVSTLARQARENKTGDGEVVFHIDH